MERFRQRIVLHVGLVGLFGASLAVQPRPPEITTPFAPKLAEDQPSQRTKLMLDGYILSFSDNMETKTAPSSPPARILSVTPKVWEGKGTVYSREGCLGCHPERIMANGEPLNDNAFTIAFMRSPLNSYVEVANLDNGTSVIAKVTDRGGFEAFNRMTDVSPAVKHAIGLITDVSNIRIRLIE